MGFADGFYYGQGKIIVDTTNLLATDVVRVRSMTAPTKVWSKTVTTPGGYMVFEVPGKDYYKISLVQEQEISGETVEVEVVNLFRTLDYGQTIVVDVLDKTHLAGIQAILNSHSEIELLSVGDEVIVNVGGDDKIFIVGALDLYASHEAILVSKYLISQTTYSDARTMTYASSNVHDYMENNFYAAISQEDKSFIKEKLVHARANPSHGGYSSINCHVWAPTYTEISGTVYDENNIQFPIFDTQDKRVKYNMSSAAGAWWSASGSNLQTDSYAFYVKSDGAVSNGGAFNDRTIWTLPCFHLTSDV